MSIIRLKPALFGLLGLVATVSLTHQAEASNVDYFSCSAGDIGHIITLNAARSNTVTVEITVGEMMDQSLARTFVLQQVPGGSGFSYEGEGYKFYGKGTSAELYVPNMTVDCEYLPNGLGGGGQHSNHSDSGGLIDRSGRSLGGKLRAGPGTNFKQVGSLAFRDQLVIVRNTNVGFDGYDWFEVNVGGQIAYQWGGIMCSDGGVLPGIYDSCENVQ